MHRGVPAVLTLLLVSAAPAGAEHRPTLRLTDEAPVTVRGSGFTTPQTVRVTFRVGDRRVVRRVRTSPTGRFRIVVRNLGFARCGRRLEVRARGTREDFAYLVQRQPDCAPGPA